MRVTEVLFRLKKALPHGHLWRGKYKLYKKITPADLARKTDEYKLEEQNMFYLRHPYLTIEQSHGHAKFFLHRLKFIEKKKEDKIKNWKEDKLLGDRFGFLRVAERWE